MGIIIPRPQMRSKENRTIIDRLARHNQLTVKYEAEGLNRKAASAKAYAEITGRASSAKGMKGPAT